ncbi:MAG TPA: DUF4340 domain-containing protein [Cyclobacteriaceae bacterium]|nr:DUF4340 domain-containing protein [Cyclobacteriaceae bacterium]HMV08831.1 DUF4340 domain-containing protein [Cyclobacteriaceae bacterium]HMV90765.1 DUF4340 domain-containing protein [Cyclobacteriaceae bacterium]HMW99977.1 DUF4340 domain-containing protein [Cyclobacteriaceae bacterium]HMX49160.1 DUF4340 domain-containing protein [Cyclobacteriaceae bacterium]
MQQKRNIRLLISLCVLTIGTAILIMIFNRDSSAVDKTVFQVADLKSVDKVVLERDSSKVELMLDASGRWRVNGELADPAMVDVLFATIQQAEPKRKISDKLTDSLTALLHTQGVHVSLFQSNERVSDFYAGGNASKTQAYFLKEGDDNVYVMAIPGYRVYTSGIFELESPGWKDKYVFGFNWQNFKNLNVVFTASPADNFDVVMDKLPVITGVQADTAKLNSFLDNVSLLTVDQYLTTAQASVYDSARFIPPVEITVTDLSGKTYALTLYPEPRKPVVFGMVQGRYPAVFNSRKILPLMKSKGWFGKK